MRLPVFTMPFEPMTIEHLGLRLYSTLPPVLAELVSNAYDAESPKVEVILPTDEITPDSEVIVRDFGHGMDASEIQTEYLPIGRNRRGDESRNTMSKNGKVRVTGRKGLGKLSSFGIADELEARSVKCLTAVTLRLNFSEMRSWAEEHPGRPYEPTVIPQRTGSTSDCDGVEVTLRKLHRTNRISPEVVRRGLASRLAMIGRNFQVCVNGVPVGPGDRMNRSECATGFSWDVQDLPHGASLAPSFHLRGWIGFLGASSQDKRGVDIFANSKAVELGSYFHYPSTHAQFARAHLVGEIHADFLDSPDADLIATARNSVVWESPEGQLLQDWGQQTLKWTFQRWVELRREAKEDTITTAAGFDKWLDTRQPGEQRAAKRMIKILVEDENLDPESARPLLEIIKSSVETVAFLELIDRIETETPTAATLLRLFEEWRVIEAREHLRLADGRRSAIDHLEKFIQEGALEVQQLQPLLVKNLWLINSAWTEADVQATYTQLLKKNCKEPKTFPEEDRRLDIIGVTESGRMTVVELKRPQKTLSRDDLDQIEDYVDWARSNIIGTDPVSPKYVEGFLIVGKLSNRSDVQTKMSRLARDDIRVATFRDLYAASRRYYDEVERHLEKIAPEYTRTKRKVGGHPKSEPE